MSNNCNDLPLNIRTIKPLRRIVSISCFYWLNWLKALCFVASAEKVLSLNVLSKCGEILSWLHLSRRMMDTLTCKNPTVIREKLNVCMHCVVAVVGLTKIPSSCAKGQFDTILTTSQTVESVQWQDGSKFKLA